MDEDNKTFFLLRMENHFDTSVDTLEEAIDILRDGVDAGISKGGIVYEVIRPVAVYGNVADL